MDAKLKSGLDSAPFPFVMVPMADYQQLNQKVDFLTDLIQQHLTVADARPVMQKQNRIGGVELAMEVTGLAKSTIYNKHHKGEIPSFGDTGNNLLFSEKQLIDWLQEGKKRTKADIQADVDSFLGAKRIGGRQVNL